MIAVDLACPDCDARIVLRTARQGALAGKPFYGCSTWPACSATHGAHPDGKPLGIPGDRATKDARIRAHAAFDLIWRSGMMSRRGAYSWMRRRFGLSDEDGHIGRFDVAACERLIAALAPLRLDDAETTAARLELQRSLVEAFGPWKPCWEGWRAVAQILGVEGSVYLIELSPVQCAQVVDAMQTGDRDRMRHGAHGDEGRMGA